MSKLLALGSAAAMVMGAAVLLGGCEEDNAKAKSITYPPYSATGTLDTSFGGNGSVFAATGIVTDDNFSTLVNGDDRAFTVTTDAAGNILVGGYNFAAGPNQNMAVLRLNSSGLLDTSFNGSGIFSADQPTATAGQEIHGIALQADGRIVAVGSVDPGAGWDPAFWRVFPNGAAFDPGFGGSGAFSSVPTGSTGADVANAVAIDSTGRVVVAGYTVQGANGFDMIVWRLLADGTLDPAFASAGVYRTQAASDQIGSALALDGAGNVYVAGSDNTGGTQKIAVWKLLGTDGTVDATFGTAGKYTHTGTAAADQANAIIRDGAGRLIVAGSINNGTDDDAAVIRLTAAGALDASFGTAGVTILAALAGGTAGADTFSGVALDVYRRIVLTGTSVGPATNANDMVLVRLTEGGALDPAFAGDGIVVSHNAAGGGGDDFGNAVTIDSSGRIVVVGYSLRTPDYDMVVWRYK